MVPCLPGQTSSGKTHTMEGPDRVDPEMQGVVPRMISTIFDKIYNESDMIEFHISVSYFEIYMEKVKDLLNPKNDNMNIREHPQRGIYVDGAREILVSSPDDVHNVMTQGSNSRSIAVTNMNEHSSRSHSVFMLTVSQTNMEDLSKKSGKLYLVDLAGSEKAAKTGASGQKMEEAKKINASLTCLGIVITKLTMQGTHIPYRDSKLTRILTESLGGNAKTCLIICCSPSVYNDAETLGTLQFGERAKMIVNKAKVNRELSIPELKQLVAKLEKKIASQQKYIKTLEGKLDDNGIELPEEGQEIAVVAGEKGADAGEAMMSLEDEEALHSAMSGRSVRKGSLDGREIELATLAIEARENEDKIRQFEEEKEFMKSLMDDLLEQLAQKEAEKKTISEEVETELIELHAQVADYSEENNVLIQKLAETTTELEEAHKAPKVPVVPDKTQDEVTAETDSWAAREEELKMKADKAAAEMQAMEDSLRSMEQVQEDSAETKAKLAEMEEKISNLEEDKSSLRAQLKDAQEGGGASAADMAAGAELQEANDKVQRVQAELTNKSTILEAKEGEWQKEKEGYLSLHKSLETQLS